MDCLTVVVDGWSERDVLLYIIAVCVWCILILAERAWWRE